MDLKKIANENVIFRCLSGSHAYGMNTEHSDEDIRAIFIAPPHVALHCFNRTEQYENPDCDEIIFELRKFVKIAVQNNPNALEFLFTEEENILFCDPLFQKLREQRHLFVTKRAKDAFTGYAMAQLRRIKGHKKWINQPQPENPPNLLDFGTLILPNGDIVPGDTLESFQNAFLVKVNATVFRVYSAINFFHAPLSDDKQNIQYIHADRLQSLSPHNLEFFGTFIIQQETYAQQHRKWTEYWQWKKHRNEVRAELEEKYSFDCKHASHLVRLLRMGKELLQSGTCAIRRPDADELLAIRNGSLTYDQLISMAEQMDEDLEQISQESNLPTSCDMVAVNDLYLDIVQEYWKRKGYRC